jgi:chromosome segregation ATPase
MPNEADDRMTAVFEALDANRGLLVALTDKVASISTRVESVATRVESVATRVESVATRVESVSTQLAGYEQRFDTLAGALLRVRGEIMDRIDRLQETVELVRSDARVNWATADTAINRARNTREDIDDLQKQIAAMERRYQTLASVVDGLRNPDGKRPG